MKTALEVAVTEGYAQCAKVCMVLQVAVTEGHPQCAKVGTLLEVT